MVTTLIEPEWQSKMAGNDEFTSEQVVAHLVQAISQTKLWRLSHDTDTKDPDLPARIRHNFDDYQLNKTHSKD